MSQIIDKNDMKSIEKSITDLINEFDFKQKELHIKKYINLNKVNNKLKKNLNFVTNLSERTSTDSEKTVLSFGSKFEITPKVLPHNEIITSVEKNLIKFEENEQKEMRNSINQILWKSKPPKSYIRKLEINAIKNL